MITCTYNYRYTSDIGIHTMVCLPTGLTLYVWTCITTHVQTTAYTYMHSSPHL